jgi:hypothetical protein
MKTAVILMLSLPLVSSAKNLVCRDIHVQDGSYVAEFAGLSGSSVITRLSIPDGEYSSKTYLGSCRSEEDTTYLHLSCQVNGPGQKKYWVTLRGTSKGSFVATANQIGAEQPVTLPCR